MGFKTVLVGAALCLAAAVAPLARAQPVAPGGAGGAGVQRDVERRERFNELRQLEIDNRLRANADIPVGQRALFDFGGYTTFNYLSIDDREGNNHGLRQYDAVGYARLNLDAANELFVRGRVSYQDFNRGDSFEGRGDELVDPDIERGYYRFDLAKYQAAYRGKALDYNVVFQGGRDLVYWGNGLAMGEVLDGMILDLSYKAVTVEVIAGVTPVRTVDIDTSRPSFDHNTRRGFYGAMLSAQAGTQRPYLYGIIQRDYNSHDFLQQGAISTKYSYNSWYVGTGMTGQITDKLAYGVEAVYEGGNTLSNSYAITGFSLSPVPQTRNDISAYAADARLDYLPADQHNSRLSAEGILASGDPDRGNSTQTFAGNRPGTRDLSFNAFGLVNTGLAFAPEVSNLLALRLGASTYPFASSSLFRRFQVGTDVFVYSKLRRYGAFDENTTHRYYLGWEPDLYVNWQITSDVTLAFRYGIFTPSQAVVSHNDPRQFLYTGVTFAF